MIAVDILGFAVMSCVASAALGYIGLQRLAGDGDKMLGSLLCASHAGGLIGLCQFISGNSGNAIYAAVPLCAMLATAAYVDWRTAWAPTELVFPICLLSAGYTAWPAYGGWVALAWSVATGGGIFASSWGLWRLQSSFGIGWVPPADAIALFLPFLLIDTAIGLTFAYLTITGALLAVRHRMHGLKDAFGLICSEDKVAFLAIVFPVCLAGIAVNSAFSEFGFSNAG